MCVRLCGLSTFSGPVDLGASIITGLIGNPVHALCRQLLHTVGLPYRPTAFSSLLHYLTSHGAVYDCAGERVDAATDARVESGIYNRALAGTDHYRHNCKANSAQQQQQQPTPHKHGIATELGNPHSQQPTHGAQQQQDDHTPSTAPTATSAASTALAATASGDEQQGASYDADRAKLQLAGGWEEALQLSLRTGMERVISELNIQMTQQERVSKPFHTTYATTHAASASEQINSACHAHTPPSHLIDHCSPPLVAVLYCCWSAAVQLAGG